MTERATDPMGLLLAAARVDPVLMRAARQVDAEVQASRKLVADLLALHHQHAPVAHFIYPYCRACQVTYPCPTVRLIEASGCSAET